MPRENQDDDLDFLDQQAQADDDVLVSYDIASYPSDFTLSGLHENWKAGDLTIPGFQRNFVWTIKQSSLLIESFLLGLPVPQVFFYIDDENKSMVIDGQQRILSVVFYLEGYFGSENIQGRRKVFRLTGLDEKSPYNRKKFDELDEGAQRKLRGSVLRAMNIRQLSPNSNTSIYHIFERLNTGGTPLRPQEIRNCVFSGNFSEILKGLNADENWRKIIGRKPFDKHQRDVELILRIFSLANYGDVYEKPMKEFLNISMKKNKNGKTIKVKNLINKFPKLTKFVVDALGDKPFHIPSRFIFVAH